MKTIHYHLNVKHQGDDDSQAWLEEMTYTVEDNVTEESHGRGIVDFFNRTLKIGEKPRVFLAAIPVGIPVASSKKILPHAWEKKSLVTEKGGYDVYQCRTCKKLGKRYGISDIVKPDRGTPEYCTGAPKPKTGMPKPDLPKKKITIEPAAAAPDWLKAKYRTDSMFDYPEIITPDYGLGISFKDDKGIEYLTIEDLPRTINVDVHSWIGTTYNAVHYYGKVEVHEPSLFYIDENGKQHTSYLGGSFDQFKPKEVDSICLNVVRPITAEELEDDDRWHGYNLGDFVEAYLNEKDLYNDAISLIKARFSGEWKVCIRGFDTDKYNKDFMLSDIK